MERLDPQGVDALRQARNQTAPIIGDHRDLQSSQIVSRRQLDDAIVGILGRVTEDNAQVGRLARIGVGREAIAVVDDGQEAPRGGEGQEQGFKLVAGAGFLSPLLQGRQLRQGEDHVVAVEDPAPLAIDHGLPFRLWIERSACVPALGEELRTMAAQHSILSP